MKKSVVVLGAGLVGSAIAIDLKKSGCMVRSVDIDKKRLQILNNEHKIDIAICDFFDRKALSSIIKNADLVIGAVPGSFGFQMLKTVIENRKNIVDISFCAENYLELDALAKKNGVIAIVDMGVAPGMCNAILGYYNAQMQIEDYKCIVGGLPVKRQWPFEYKASWSPIDVIEEYTRPARFIVNGKLVTKPAMSDLEKVEFGSVGTLEEWNSDGLRSLLDTMPHIPNMVEKTLRYPGTMDYMKMLGKTGFFSNEEITVKNIKVKPIDLTSQLLFPAWQLDEGEEEFTVMRVCIRGTKDSIPGKIIYELYDRYSKTTNTSSMARTTGYTCTGAAHLILNGVFKRTGINPPEYVGADSKCFDFLIKHLEERGVIYTKSV